MPTYDYKCPKCDIIEERFHSMSDEPIFICHLCSERMVKCVGGGIGVHFTGSGFYETDYNGK